MTPSATGRCDPEAPPTPLSPQDAVDQAVRGRCFTKRRYAWIASAGGFFLKVPRVSDSLEADAASSVTRAMARQEFEELSFLADLTPAVIRPITVDARHACLVFPHVHGRDLRLCLRQAAPAAKSQENLFAALEILADIHRHGARKSPPPAAPGSGAPAGAARPPTAGQTITIEGFEIRNFLVEDGTGRVWFYDPHYLAAGCPEEDVMRFVLSLLMLNWSRSFSCRIWTSFSYPALAGHYQAHSIFALDPGRLRAAFAANLELRFDNAGSSIARMPALLRPAARFYRRIYFSQLRAWAARHGL